MRAGGMTKPTEENLMMEIVVECEAEAFEPVEKRKGPPCSTKPNACSDRNVQCPVFAQKGLCDSARDRDYMNGNCKLSCGVCQLATATTTSTLSDTCKRGEYFNAQLKGEVA